MEASERALASASSAEAKEQAEDARAKAATLAIELSARLATAKAELQPKLDAVGPAREALVAAEAARAAAGGGPQDHARPRADVDLHQPQDRAPLYPTGL